MPRLLKLEFKIPEFIFKDSIELGINFISIYKVHVSVLSYVTPD